MQMRPDAKQHKDADYFRALVAKTNMTHSQIAKRIGVTDRSIRRYVKNGSPYPIQFAVECLIYGID